MHAERSLLLSHTPTHPQPKNTNRMIRYPPFPPPLHFPSFQTHPEYQIEGKHQVFDAHLSPRQRGHGGTWHTDHTSAAASPLEPTTQRKTFYITVYAEWGYLPTRRHWYVRRAVRACSGPPPHITGLRKHNRRLLPCFEYGKREYQSTKNPKILLDFIDFNTFNSERLS